VRGVPGRQALTGEPMTVFGEGSADRSSCYVSDLVEGIYRLSAPVSETRNDLS